MTDLLRTAFERAARLPSEEQNALALVLLDGIGTGYLGADVEPDPAPDPADEPMGGWLAPGPATGRDRARRNAGGRVV